MPIFTSRARTSWATGAGTAETAEQAVEIPSNVKEIIAVRGHVVATNGDPAESIIGVFRFVGDNFKNRPYEWFSEIGSGKVGAIDEVGYEREPRWWDCHLPVSAGSPIGVTYEPIDALANNGRASIDLKFSTQRTGMTPRLRKCTRETATSTTTGEALSLTKVGSVVDFCWGESTSTVAADDPVAASIVVTCESLIGQQDISLNTTIHTIEATSGVAKTSLQYAEIDMPSSNPTARFTAQLTQDVDLGTAGQWFYSIGYIPTSIEQVD